MLKQYLSKRAQASFWGENSCYMAVQSDNDDFVTKGVPDSGQGRQL